MDIIPILSTIILISTLVTLVLAVGSYFAYRLRESRRPKSASQLPKPVFFRKYASRKAAEGSPGS